MFINNGNGTFRATSAAPFSGASVQAIVGDYNNDKRFDLLVVNDSGASVVFKNVGNDASGNPKFAKVNVGISGATHGRGAAFGDFNNDGLLDLVLIQSEGGNILFLNNGNSTFSSLASVFLNNPQNPTALITGDFDNDGLIDIMIGDGNNTQTGGDSLYKNTSGKNHWLEVSLQGTTSNRSAIDAVIVVRNGDTFQSRLVSGGNGSSQDSLVMHFGLGKNTKIDEMEILWPSGVSQRCLNVNANRKIQVTEGSPSNLGCQ
jgi:ASPIC/UnbV protein/VCBS repeat protein